VISVNTFKVMIRIHVTVELFKYLAAIRSWISRKVAEILKILKVSKI